RKTYKLLLHLSPHSHHERQAKEEKVFSFSVGAGASTARFGGRRRRQDVFDKKLVGQGCVADGKSLCFCACVPLSCLQVSLTCKRKS
ncbi:MAG: hypothetical protein IJW09_01275, partial [Clostridia bacterium]|nr:hypothetical protein [Clostridia bacterium]